MDQIFLDYVNHPESKSEGDVGILSRKHIRATGIEYIGKETKRIEDSYK